MIFICSLGFHSELKAASQIKKEIDQKETILNLLYLRKFEPAVSLLKSLSSDSAYYRDLLVGVQVQILAHKEKWNDIVNFNFPSELGAFGKTLVYIAKGMAFAHKRDMQQAIEQIRLINELKSHKSYKRLQKEVDYSSLFLSGYVRLQQRKFHNTLRLFKRSSKIESKFQIKNPYSWVYNALFYLGFTYELTARKHEAVASYKKVLKRWPNMTKAALKIKEISI